MDVAPSLTSLKAFLSDPQSYHFLNDWHHTQLERATADRFWHLCAESGETIPGNPSRRTFRRRFERAQAEHKLGIYATLHETQSELQLSSDEHYPLLKRHYKPDEVHDKTFLKALIALGPHNINTLVSAAAAKDAMAERKGRIKRLRRAYNHSHGLTGNDGITKEDVALMVEHYVDVMHIPFGQAQDIIMNVVKGELSTLLATKASAQQARQRVARALAQAPPIPSMPSRSNRQAATTPSLQHIIQREAPASQRASAATSTQQRTSSQPRRATVMQTPRLAANVAARNRRRKKKSARKAAERKQEAREQNATITTSQQSDNDHNGNLPLPDDFANDSSSPHTVHHSSISRRRSPSPELGGPSVPQASQSSTGRKRKRSATSADQHDEAAAEDSHPYLAPAPPITGPVPESPTSAHAGPTTSAEQIAAAAQPSLDEDEQVALWLQQQPSPQPSSRPSSSNSATNQPTVPPENTILTPEREDGYVIAASPGDGRYYGHPFGVDLPERALEVRPRVADGLEQEEDDDDDSSDDDEDLDLMDDGEAEEDGENFDEQGMMEEDVEDEEPMTHTQSLAVEDEARAADSDGSSTPRASHLPEVSPELGSSQRFASSQAPATGEASQLLQDSLGLRRSQSTTSSQAQAPRPSRTSRFAGHEGNNNSPKRLSFVSRPTQASEGQSTVSYPQLPDAEGLGSPMAGGPSLYEDRRDASDVSDNHVASAFDSQRSSQSELPLSLREICRRNSIRPAHEDSEGQLPKQDVHANDDTFITASQAEEFSTIVNLLTPEPSSQPVAPSRAAAPSPSPSIALSKRIEKERAETAASPIRPFVAREGTPSCSAPPTSSGSRTLDCVLVTSPEARRKPTPRRSIHSQISAGSPPPQEQVFRPLATSPYRLANHRVTTLNATASPSSRRNAAASPRPVTPQNQSAAQTRPTIVTPTQSGISSTLSSPRSTRSFATAFSRDPHSDDEDGSTPRPTRASFQYDSRFHGQLQRQPSPVPSPRQQSRTSASPSMPSSNLRSRHPRSTPSRKIPNTAPSGPYGATARHDSAGTQQQGDFHDPMIRYA